MSYGALGWLEVVDRLTIEMGIVGRCQVGGGVNLPSQMYFPVGKTFQPAR